MVKGTFSPQGSDDTLNYEVETWWDEKGRQYRGAGYDDRDFMKTDRIMVYVTGGKDDTNLYCTVWGPFETRDFITDILSDIFGTDGSLNIVT